MESAEIKRQLEHLKTYPTAITHCNGVDLAYFIPAQIAELVAAVESLTAEKEAAEREVDKLKRRCAITETVLKQGPDGLWELADYRDRNCSLESGLSESIELRKTAESSLAQAREEIERLTTELCRYYNADGSFFHYATPELALEARQKAAKLMARLKADDQLTANAIIELKHLAEAAEQREKGLMRSRELECQECKQLHTLEVGRSGFEQGYVLAVANLVRMFDEPTIGSNLLREFKEVDWRHIDVSDTDTLSEAGILPEEAKAALAAASKEEA